VLSIEGDQKESMNWREQETMSTNRYLEVSASVTRLDEQPGKFTSRWAIPRVEAQVESRPKKKKRQINNIFFLFIIFVFKQTRKLFSGRSNRA